MSIALPPYLEEAKYLVGFEFPQADEDALRRCGVAWRAAASGVRDVQSECFQVADRVEAALGGAAGLAFQSVWRQVASPGSGFLEQLARGCDQMADACEHAAIEVEYAKYEFIGALALLAGTVAVLVALLFAGGLSAGGIPLAIATAQTTIRTVLTRLIASIVVSELYSVGLDALGQGLQLLAGHRSGWDWAKTRRAAEDGAIYGVVNAGTFGLAGKAAPRLLRTVTGRAAVAGVAGVSGVGTSAVVHGDIPTGKGFLLSLSSGLAQGVPHGVHGRGEVADPHPRAWLKELDRFEVSTVELAHRHANASGISAADRDSSEPVTGRSTSSDEHDLPPQLAQSESAHSAYLSPSLRPRVVDTAPSIGARDQVPDGVDAPSQAGTPTEVQLTGGAGNLARVASLHVAGTRPAETCPVLTADPAAPERPHVRPAEASDATRSGGEAMPFSGPSSSHSPTNDSPAPALGVDDVRDSTSDTSLVDAAFQPREDIFVQLSDAEVHDLVHDTVFVTDAGLAFYVDGDSTRDFARAVEPTPGYVTLDLHGGTDGFYIDGHRITPEQFAQALRDLRTAGGLELPVGVGVKLLSCETAFGADESPAAKLARALGVEVIAPDRVVWTSMGGVEIVSSPAMLGGYVIPKYPPDGGWHRFAADGSELGLAFDPGYHGPTVDGSRPLSQFDRDSYDRDLYDWDPYDWDPYVQDGNGYDHLRPDRAPAGDPYTGNALDDYDDVSDGRRRPTVIDAGLGRRG